MNESERAALASMRECWITGGVASELAPAVWKEIAGSAQQDDRERRLLAIAGQAFDVALRPAAPKLLITATRLPRLALPALDERMRPLFRIALKHAGDARARMRVVALVASRGFIAHPLDWMPTASDLDAPRVYAPWVDWQADAGRKSASTFETLTAESWHEFFPAARRALLIDMRKSDPAAARALLETKAASEPAETRLSLIECLRTGLSLDDAPFLASLSGDRSGKVRQLAARLLARLGKRDANGAGEGDSDVAELAGFIEQGRAGLLRRRTVYGPLTLKSNAQQQRRAELFDTCQLVDVAAKLGTDEIEFVAAWQLGTDAVADAEFAGMVAASGSDQAVAQFADRLFAAGSASLLSPLLSRLDERAKRRFIQTILSGGAGLLHLLNTPEDIEPGTIDSHNIMTGSAYKETRAAIAGSNEAERQAAFANLTALGFVASASAAQSIAADLIAAGLAPADPALALLRLNAALGASQPHAAP